MHVPIKLVSHDLKYRRRQCPKHIRTLLTKKAAVWRVFRTTRSAELRDKYNRIANDCKLAILNFDMMRERKILDANNLGAFYRYVNGKLCNKSGIAPLYNDDNILLTSDSDKANLLNSYFQSVFTADDGLLPPFPSRVPPGSPGLSDVDITPAIVLKILRKLKTNSAAGPDGLPSILFSKCAVSFVTPLSILFRSLIDLKSLPMEWKHAIITPVFKKGSPSDKSNYRPIALTCSCCKILESIIVDNVLQYLTDHNLITKHQHGFIKNHSTVSNLLESINDWNLSLSRRNSVDIVYIDFKRAFDSISHRKLIHKLAGYGIQGNLLLWITAFLDSRSQSVRVGSALSPPSLVISGVPQGSCIGCALFILFINDVTDCITPSTFIKLFADDLKLYSEVSCSAHSSNIQHNLDLIFIWSNTWQLPISTPKCNTLHLGSSPANSYSISNQYLCNVSPVKDLGILVDSRLKFVDHIQDIVSRASKRANLVFRCFLSRNTTNLTKAFVTYVRPLLEYASPVWSPSYLYLINHIESVHNLSLNVCHSVNLSRMVNA